TEDGTRDARGLAVANINCAAPAFRQAPKLKRESEAGGLRFPFKIWSGKRGSNSRPQPWQGCALPLSYSRAKRNVIIGSPARVSRQAGALAGPLDRLI